MRRPMAQLAPLLLALMLGVSPTEAQEAPTGDLGLMYTVEVLPGHTFDFEDGIKQYWEDVAEAGGTMSWAVFQIQLGPRSGQYAILSTDRSGADLEAPEGDAEAIQESFRRNLTPHMQSYEGSMIRRLVDLGFWTPEQELAPMYQVIRQWVAPGSDAAVSHYFGQIREAFEARGGARHSIWRTAMGSTGDEWYISVPRDSFSEFDEYNPNWLPSMLAEHFGHAGMQAIVESVDGLFLKQTNELFVLRRDLSFGLPDPGM